MKKGLVVAGRDGMSKDQNRWGHKLESQNLSLAKEKVSFISIEGVEYPGCKSCQLYNFDLLWNFLQYLRICLSIKSGSCLFWFWGLFWSRCSPLCPRNSLPLPPSGVLGLRAWNLGNVLLFVWELEFKFYILDSYFIKELYSKPPKCTSEDRKVLSILIFWWLKTLLMYQVVVLWGPEKVKFRNC